MADVQTGVGPFVAAALTTRGWNASQAGTLLTVGGLTGLGLQAPAGALVDKTHRKRTLVALGVAATVAASMVFAYENRFLTLLGAQFLLGTAGPFIGNAITAITLGLVGKAAFDTRLGRNASFNSAGNLFSALLMGWIGWHWGVQSIFFAVPFLAIPTLLALGAIPANQIDHVAAQGSEPGAGSRQEGLRTLLRDRGLVAFGVSVFLFHLSNAAMLPQLGELLANGRAREAVPFMSAAVSVTQIVIALGSPLVGKMSARWGPRPILMIGFVVLPIRGVLYTFTNAVPLLLAIQILDGIANAIFGVASPVYVAERTRGSGRFNLAMGGLGTAVGTGASLSTVLAGIVAQRAGFAVSFLVLAGIAALAFLCLVFWVPSASRTPSGQRQDKSVAVGPSA